MTDTNEVESAPVVEGKSSDQILAEINEAQRQLETQPAKVEVSEPEVPSEPVQAEPETADKPSETAETSESAEVVPVPSGSDKTGEKDEWMEKKGFKSNDDIIRSYRNLERELHRRGKVVNKEVMPPIPSVPEPRPSVPVAGIQNLAEQYQMTPDDVQKIAQLANDIADYKLNQRLQPLAEQFAGLKLDYEKEASFKRLERDPLFRNREVLKEMHQLAESDPSILSIPDYPERVFDKALSRIGRKFAEGSIQGEIAPRESRLGLPSSPPPGSKGSGGGPKGIPVRPPTNVVSNSSFKRLSVAEMEKRLKDMGAIKNVEY